MRVYQFRHLGNTTGKYFQVSFIQNVRAENGTRTRDPDLGKVVLYQLSYFRIMCLAFGADPFRFGLPIGIAKIGRFSIVPKFFEENCT